MYVYMYVSIILLYVCTYVLQENAHTRVLFVCMWLNMGCELINFDLAKRDDCNHINHEGLRQIQTSHVKAH